MKCSHIGPKALLAVIVTMCGVFAVGGVLAQERPKTVMKEGHASPLMAKVIYKDGKEQTLALVLTRMSPATETSHIIGGMGDGGSTVTLWLDTIKTIKNTRGLDATFVLKNGKEVDLEFRKGFDCLGGGGFWATDESEAKVGFWLQDVKTVEFLKPLRKDAKDNAMFDHWKYSPYTGERLPPVIE